MGANKPRLVHLRGDAMSVCLIRDGQIASCLALHVAVFFSVGVFLGIASNLIAERIRGKK